MVTGVERLGAPPLPATAYARIEGLLAARRCVILDGGTATELERLAPAPAGEHDEPLWGTWALGQAPGAVLDVHRRYVGVGCDVISTNTWGLLDASERFEPESAHWTDLARRGVQVGREAIEREGRAGEVALAFSVHGDVGSPERRDTLEVLARVLAAEPPDLLLLETMTLLRGELTYGTLEALLATGLPVWVSFRRCRHGVCGVYGQHWGGPEGDEFGRAARRFESLGVGALLLNCLPPDHVAGMLPWLRDFTDLPLGVYPNLGYYTNAGWSFDAAVGPEEYAELALGWREEGADLVGGCCGVRPEHVARARERLAATPRGERLRASSVVPPREPAAPEEPAPAPWLDPRGRSLFPLPFPDVVCEPGVFVPTQGSFVTWKHLFREQVGAGAACLDIGCGTGLLSVQLALNGARGVHAIDVDRRAVANTLANAFRNGVADRVSGEAVDLYPWVPPERYDVVVASLYQMPVDPFEGAGSHRPLDFWGRNLVDHLITLLPALLAPDGRAYVMQLSILGRRRTQALLERHGLVARVVDFSPFPFTPLFAQRAGQIRRVEELSDAFHLQLGADSVMVAYLLEVRHGARAPSPEAEGAERGTLAPRPFPGIRSAAGIEPSVAPSRREGG